MDYLPKLRSLVIRDTPEEENKVPKTQDALNVLLVGTDDCEVQLLALGTFLCGSIKLAEVFGQEGAVLNTHMPADFGYLYVAVQYAHGQVEIVTIELKECDTTWDDVYDLASKHDQLLSSLDYLDRTMKNILETWENVSLMEMELKLSSYSADDPELVSTDLLGLMIFGNLSERMDQFLRKDLTDKGIKKIGQSIESSHTNVQKLVVKQLAEVTNRVLFQLVEVSGMSLKKYECLGLTERSVDRALLSAQRFLMKCNELQIVIAESLTRYQLFFKWLHGAMTRLNDDAGALSTAEPAPADLSQRELHALAEYVYELGDGARAADKYRLDRVGQYFADADLEFPRDAAGRGHWRGVLRENPCLEDGSALVVKAAGRASLAQQYAALRRDLADIFAQRKTFADRAFVLYNNVRLDNHGTAAGAGGARRPPKVTMADAVNGKLLVCCADRGSYDFGFHELMAYADGAQVTRRAVNAFYMGDDAVKQTVHDVQFYSAEHLSVLTETADAAGNRSSLFLQLSTSGLRLACSSDGLNTCRIGSSSSSTASSSCHQMDDYTCRVVENMSATSFAVCGTRKVAVLLSHSRHKVRLFEMEAEDEEDEEDDSTAMDVTRDSSFAD